MRQLSIDSLSLDHRQNASTPSIPARRWHPVQPARRLLARLSFSTFLHAQDTPPAGDCATDQELVQLTEPMGRLRAEDVRWDLINAAHSGRRYRI